MSKYFKNITSFDELKAQFRELLKKNHPDNGGDSEAMKEINCEYDALFPIWKNRKEQQTGETITETAESTRVNFYTQNGWCGKNYSGSRTLKEIAVIVRTYMKEKYPTCKFSVRTAYASMCQELIVKIKEFPEKMYKTGDDLRKEGLTEHIKTTISYGEHKGEPYEYDKYTEEVETMLKRLNANHLFNKDSWDDEELIEAYENAIKDNDFYAIRTEYFNSVIKDIDAFVNSYNYSDCDGMIDYFDVNFYYFGCGTSECKVVPKTARIKCNNSVMKENNEKQKTADIEPETVTTEKHTAESENVTENHTEPETATAEEKQPENVKATFTAFSDFEELAKAYATGKTATPKKKTEPKPEEPKQAEQAEAKKPEPEPEPVKPLHNENFTAEEIAKLTTGGCVIKEFKPYTTHYTALHATDNIMVWYVYKQENYSNYNFRIGERNNLKYTGFIYNGKMYTDYKRINEAFTEAINARMIEMIPTEQDAWNRAGNLSEWEGEQLRDFIKIDWTAEARKYFYKGEEPQLKLFDSYKAPSSEEEALYYITRPDEAVQTFADTFIKGRVASIIKIYIEYNGICEGLKQIKAHPENIAHTIKKISDCVTDEKTVKVTVKTGETYRINARDIKILTHWSYIPKYDIPGRDTDIKPEEIAEITHGKRILYSA